MSETRPKSRWLRWREYLSEYLPHDPRARALMITAFVASFAFVIFGAMSDDPSGNNLAGRGGALAVAVSFGILFTRETLTEDAFKRLESQRKRLRDALSSSREQPDYIVEAILKILGDRSRGQTRQNIALAVVGVVGTLAWGFGDLPAVAIYPIFHGGNKPSKQGAGASPSPVPISGKASPTPQ